MPAKNTFTDRLLLLGNFYMPAMRLQLTLAAIVLMLCYLGCLASLNLLHSENNFLGIGVMTYSAALSLAGFTYYCGPLLFAFCRNRAVATTLPASWPQKSVFFLGWCLIAYPAFLAVVWYAMVGIASLFTPFASVNAAFLDYIQSLSEGISPYNIVQITGQHWYTNILSSLIVMSCTAWGVCNCRRNRLVFGIVGAFAGMALNFLAGMIMGILGAASTDLIRGIADGMEVDPEMFAEQFLDYMLRSADIVSAVMGIGSAILLAMCVVKIKNRQN